jgi:hypothetical protein
MFRKLLVMKAAKEDEKSCKGVGTAFAFLGFQGAVNSSTRP